MNDQILKAMKVSLTIFLCKTEALKYYYAFVYIPTEGINGLIARENVCELTTPSERYQLEHEGEVEILIEKDWIETISSWLVETWRV